MAGYIPPINNNDIFNVSAFSFQDSPITYHQGDIRYALKNEVSTSGNVAEITGNVIQGTTGNFTNITGNLISVNATISNLNATSATINSIVGTSILGDNIRGTTGNFTSITGNLNASSATINSIIGSSIVGDTIQGTNGNFTSITGNLNATSATITTMTGSSIVGDTIQGTNGNFTSITGNLSASSVSSTSFIENGVALSAKYAPINGVIDFSGVVDLTSNQTITGIKTFNGNVNVGQYGAVISPSFIEGGSYLTSKYVDFTSNQNIYGQKQFLGEQTTATFPLTVNANSQNIGLSASLGLGSYNSIVQANDAGIIWTGTSADTPNTGFVIAPWVGGVRGFRIAPNGNVGIGTTDPNYTLDVAGSIHTSSSIYIEDTIRSGASDLRIVPSGTNNLFLNNGKESNGNKIVMNYSSPNSYVVSYGNFGIGIDPPSYKLDVNGDARISGQIIIPSSKAIWWENPGSNTFIQGYLDNIIFYVAKYTHQWNIGDAQLAYLNASGFTVNNTIVGTAFSTTGSITCGGNLSIGTGNALYFGTNAFYVSGNEFKWLFDGTSKMSLNSSGGLTVTSLTATTINGTNFNFTNVSANTLTVSTIKVSGWGGRIDYQSIDGNFIFYNALGEIYTFIHPTEGINAYSKPIITTGQITAGYFNTTSDYRIKTNVREITESIDGLQPKKYYNKLTNKTDFGFIAHELADEFPEMVNGEKDARDENGEAKYQSINYTQIIALLVKEVQDLKAQVQILKNII